jgi:hypothetical protein
MTAEERATAIRLLEHSHDEFLGAVESVSEEQWVWRPGPEQWSVGLIAEHVMLAEATLFFFVERVIGSPPSSDWEARTGGKTAVLESQMADRGRKARAPQRVQPSGLGKDTVIPQFCKLRANTIRFARETQAPLQEHTLDHPLPGFGTLNGYQWLLNIPLHNLRHNRQIAEVKASAGYPAGR